MASAIDMTGLILGGAIAAGTPVLYATAGEVIAQRSGVVNLGLEGAMSLGAVAAVATALATGNNAPAVVAGAAAGAAIGLLHGLLVVGARLAMLASGLCLFFVGRGLSAFWGHRLVGRPVPGLAPVAVPGLSRLPIVGPALFRQDVLVYLAVAIAAATFVFLFRTRMGLKVRAAGEDAAVARAEGVPVGAIRVACAAAGAALAGVGGAHIALAFSHSWLEGLPAGRGWVAIGLVVLTRWNPLAAVPVAYLFGGIMAFQLNAQAAGLSVSPYLLSMLPYLVTIVALTVAQVWARGPGMPAELARNKP